MLRAVRNFLFDISVGSRRGLVPMAAGDRFTVIDTARETADDKADTRAMLRDYHWPAVEFEVICQTAPARADVRLEFTSPLPGGDPTVDRVTLDWYAAKDQAGQLCQGQAVLALDVLQANNIISSFVARNFARAGVHGFVMHMPHSGQRSKNREYDYADFLPGVRQAMGDARRARDVILALPGVSGPVAIQGTSFGGFIASVSAALDDAFNPVLIALAGGDIFGVMTRGRGDSALLRQKLAGAGLRSDQALKNALVRTEPLRVAHRLNRSRTWLYTARRDQVVPFQCSLALMAAAGLHGGHHRRMSGCHYTCAFNYARPLAEMIRIVRSTAAGRCEAHTPGKSAGAGEGIPRMAVFMRQD